MIILSERMLILKRFLPLRRLWRAGYVIFSGKRGEGLPFWGKWAIMTMLRVPVAKLDIASDSDSEDRGFESRRARHLMRSVLIQDWPHFYCANRAFQQSKIDLF